MPFRYCACYCEENIFCLCRDLIEEPLCDLLKVVFISNSAQQITMLRQRAGDAEFGLVTWDYHVIALARQSGSWLVYDLDTTLGHPVRLDDYLSQCFLSMLPPAPQFRVVPADEFLARFASDRRHMKSAAGEWLASPPSWPAIGSGSNLADWVDMERESFGRVLTLDQLRDEFVP